MEKNSSIWLIWKLHQRRAAKIWKDGHRSQKCSLTAKCRPVTLLSPACFSWSWRLTEMERALSPFPHCWNRWLSDTGAMNYELETILKEIFKIWNSLLQIYIHSLSHSPLIPISPSLCHYTRGKAFTVMELISGDLQFFWVLFTEEIVWLVTDTEF